MSIKITGLEQIQTKLKKLSKHLDENGMKKNLSTIGEMVRNSIEESFDNQKSPFGSEWKQLEVSTKKQKAKKGKSSLILRAEGNLADNWDIHSSSTKVTVSNNANSPKGFPYGLSHQFGSSKRNIPARPFLPVGDDGVFEQSLKDDILDFLDDEFDRVLN